MDLIYPPDMRMSLTVVMGLQADGVGGGMITGILTAMRLSTACQTTEDRMAVAEAAGFLRTSAGTTDRHAATFPETRCRRPIDTLVIAVVRETPGIRGKNIEVAHMGVQTQEMLQRDTS